MNLSPAPKAKTPVPAARKTPLKTPAKTPKNILEARKYGSKHQTNLTQALGDLALVEKTQKTDSEARVDSTFDLTPKAPPNIQVQEVGAYKTPSLDDIAPMPLTPSDAPRYGHYLRFLIVSTFLVLKIFD